MPNESGATATSDARHPATRSPDHPAPSIAIPYWLVVPALGWLAVTLWSARTAQGSTATQTLQVIEAAIGLPAVISAAIVGGAATGLAVVRLLGHRLSDRSTARFAVALGAGLVVGIASAALIVVGNSTRESAVMVLGAVAAAGATLGGALAGVRHHGVVGAGVAAALGVFLLTLLRGLFDGQLLAVFGGGDTPVELLAAQRRLSWAAAGVSGLLAGLIAFGYLRRATRHAAEPPRWPAYLAAGGSVGALHLLTELIARIGGARVLDLARSVSESDALYQDLAEAARLNSALVILFAGALTAMIAFGRTLGPGAGHGEAD